MALVPCSAGWYLAEIVVEMKIGNSGENVVYVNLTLIHAETPEEAYEKATELGNGYNRIYLNTDQEQVKSVFRGFQNFYAVEGHLEDGDELLYSEFHDLGEDQVIRLIKPKERLAIFRISTRA